MDAVSQEVVDQVGHNDARAAGLMQYLTKQLHTLGPARRHIVLRALVRAAKGTVFRERERERYTVHWDPYPSYFIT
jgi:hypothetical protein